ncbi:reverse transcriptase domain-containing protein [Tanacetum coccineum]|uniref:Reverse transcriptase domain-containing protein n=1 Tax=Tanacetum coccineum TaxID=301880 RepID=A0ABQ5BDG5_9ASTR
MPRDCLRIIESKSKVRNSRNKPVVTKVSASSSTPGISPDVAELKDMVKVLLLDKKSQAPAPVKAVEESCVTCGGAHSYRNCPATDGNVYRENIQEYISQATTANFNQGNTGYRAPIANQIRPLSSGTLPSNTITNPKVDLKGITTRSGVAYQGPTIPTTSSSPPKVVERETEVTKDTVPPTNNGSTKDVQPPVVQVQPQVPNSEPVVAPVSVPMPNLKPSIPYPSRRNDERRREKANDQIEKFYKIFKDLSFEISLTDALILMPKFASTLKALIGNKEKLSEMARTPLNEHCSAVILNKLPEKLGDPGKFLIPCDFPGMDECLALADLGASINLMPLSVWKKLSLPELTPTCMTLELADRSITQPIELKVCEAKTDKSSIDEPPEVELKDLPPHLEYAFLEGDNKLPVIIAKDLSVEEKVALIKVLKSHKQAIAWKLSDIKGINPEFCTHKILMEEDYKPAAQHQRRVDPKIYDVIKKVVEKLLDAGLIYPISDSPWMAEQDIPPPTITAMRIPIIRKGEYDIWSMRMRQYICHTDHNLWDVIVNSDLKEEPAPTGETSAPPAPRTAKQLMLNHFGKRSNQGLGYGTQLNEMSNNSETDSEISLSVFDVRSSDEESTPANDRFSKADRYHVIPPPITGNFLTLRADISFTGLDEYDIRKKIIASKTTKLNADTSKSKTSETIDNEDNVSEVQTVNPVKTNDQICQTSKKAGIGFKKIKACFVCKSIDHLIKDCDFYDKRSPEPKLENVVNTGLRVVKPVWDNAKRVNHQKISKYHHFRKTFVPLRVLTRTGLITLVKQNEKREVHKFSTARPVSTVRPFAPKIAQTSGAIRPIYPRMDNVRPRGSYSPIKRSYYTKPAFRPIDLKQEVKTFGVQNMTTAGTRAVNNTSKVDHSCSRRLSNLDILLQDHAVVDSGCSSHMTGNKAYLSDYEDYNGGFVAFGSNHKGDELKFNLLSVSQMCDKKNSVLFTESECLILCSSKAFRVYNKRTKRVEENQHIDFLEDQLNMTGTGPNWMFDLDFLTNSMNYIPVSIENQVNVDAGTQDSYVAVEDVAPTAHEKPSESSPKYNDVQVIKDVANKEGQHRMTEDEQVLHDELEKMIAQEVVTKALDDATRQAFEKEKRNIASQKREAQATSTNKLSTVRSYVSTATTPYVSAASTPTCANAGESSFVYLGGQIPIDASTLPNTDLPTDLNMPDLEDVSNAFLKDGIFSGAYDDADVGAEVDFNNMDNTIDVSLIPTLRVYKDHSKGKILGDPKSAEEGIDYDEVFAPVARIEAIRLFLAFASYMGFIVYQIDIKSAFLYGTIEEEMYVHQPIGSVDPTHPNKVYKVIKALYGLHQALRAWYKTLSSFLMENGFRRGTIDKTLFIKKKKSDIILVQVSMGELTFFLGLQVKQQPDGIFISQDKYVCVILKKFDFCSIRTATTPIESNKPLVKDEDGVDVDEHVYRSMIGSLMYLTTSRLDIMFAVCAYTRFQVTPKASHLNAVKSIFRYLKHQPKLGLWYPRDSPFELEAYSDSDYGGASLDRKSTTEYVAAANCCGQVLWIQNQMMDYGFNFMNTKIHIDNESTISVIKNPVAHSRTKHIEIRFHFIRDCYEKRLIEVIKIHTDHNVADLLTKGFGVTRFNFLVVSIGLLNLESLERDIDGTEELLLPDLLILWLTKVSNDSAKLVPLGKDSTAIKLLEKIPPRIFLHEAPFTMLSLYITANVAGKLVNISKASIRSDLLFDDADGIDSLHNQAIFDVIQVTDQAKEIKHLKAQIKKLKKKAKLVITHHKAWMTSGRKPAKSKPTVHKDPAFDDLDEVDVNDAMDYMETNAYMQKGVSTEDQVSTVKPNEGTDKPTVSTDKPEVSTAKPKEVEVSTDKLDEGTVEPKDGTSDESTAPTIVFRDDKTIAEFLVSMSQTKAKQKGVEIKDAEY